MLCRRPGCPGFHLHLWHHSHTFPFHLIHTITYFQPKLMRPGDPDWPLSHLQWWHSISISSPSHTRHSLVEILYTQATPGDLFDPVGYLISNNDLASQFSIRSHSPDIPHIPGATDKDAAQLSRNCGTVRNCVELWGHPRFLVFQFYGCAICLIVVGF